MPFLLRFMPTILSWGIFIFVFNTVPYPDSLVQGTLPQMALFFVSLYLAAIFTFNIFLKNILMSALIALCLLLLLILKALDSLNIVTGILILIAAGLFFSYFKKNKRGFRGIRKNRV